MALAQQSRIVALIVQNAVAHNEGLGAAWEIRRAFWADREAHEQALQENFLSESATRNRHVGHDPDVSLYDPDLWTDELAFLKAPRPSTNPGRTVLRLSHKHCRLSELASLASEDTTQIARHLGQI